MHDIDRQRVWNIGAYAKHYADTEAARQAGRDICLAVYLGMPPAEIETDSAYSVAYGAVGEAARANLLNIRG